MGTEHESIVPYQAFLTKDGRYYVVGAGNDAAFSEVFFILIQNGFIKNISK